MILTSSLFENISVLIPLIIAMVTSIGAPIIVSKVQAKRQGQGKISDSIIQEGKDMRQELRVRIDKLEERLDSAQEEMNKALDQMRELRYLNERCNQVIEDLKTQLIQKTTETENRLLSLEKDKT